MLIKNFHTAWVEHSTFRLYYRCSTTWGTLTDTLSRHTFSQWKNYNLKKYFKLIWLFWRKLSVIAHPSFVEVTFTEVTVLTLSWLSWGFKKSDKTDNLHICINKLMYCFLFQGQKEAKIFPQTITQVITVKLQTLIDGEIKQVVDINLCDDTVWHHTKNHLRYHYVHCH